jgi:serine O-acetyltransferase
MSTISGTFRRASVAAIVASGSGRLCMVRSSALGAPICHHDRPYRDSLCSRPRRIGVLVDPPRLRRTGARHRQRSGVLRPLAVLATTLSCCKDVWSMSPLRKTKPLEWAPLSTVDKFFIWFVYLSRRRFRLVLPALLRLMSVDIPGSVKIGKDLKIGHVGFGLVIHGNTEIGDRVVLNAGVLVGRLDQYGDFNKGPAHFVIEDDVIIGSNAVVMCRGGETVTLGEGSVVAAGAVLRESTGPWEVWAGNPAKKAGDRPKTQSNQGAVPE